MARAPKHSRAMMALGAASLVHLLAFFAWQNSSSPIVLVVEEAPEPMLLASVELLSDPSPTALVGAIPAIETPSALPGAADQVAADPKNGAAQTSSAPGQTFGRRAPGELGQESFSDRQDPSYRSKSLWNTPGAAQMQSTSALKVGATTPESMERQPDPAFAASERRTRRAREGSKQATPGLADSSGQGGAPVDDGREWLAIDPRFDSAPLARESALAGSIRTSAESPRTELGLHTAENKIRGPATEALDAPARSNRRVASPFDLGAASSGAEAEALGAGGKDGRSPGGRGGSGTASQVGGQGHELASTEASRSIPYFLSMYRRIDRELRFPKKLALGLEQGETILSFQLDTQGQVRSLSVKKSSGFKEFDREAQRAFLAAAPFGRVPKALLRDREHLSVIAPYYFRNPLIR